MMIIKIAISQISDRNARLPLTSLASSSIIRRISFTVQYIYG